MRHIIAAVLVGLLAPLAAAQECRMEPVIREDRRLECLMCQQVVGTGMVWVEQRCTPPQMVTMPTRLAECIKERFEREPLNLPYQLKLWSEDLLAGRAFRIACGTHAWVVQPE